ncbi:Gag protease polyprotein [Theobroma cacao]|uniref:Gag protease polyprotein n=1 Tax=Theobroma cacao TaxID=3641 RepID=A0A061E3P0_THECC|nr:Gag protease polyprotein [Theobroma cacao]
MNVYRDFATVVTGSKGVPDRDNSCGIRAFGFKVILKITVSISSCLLDVDAHLSLDQSGREEAGQVPAVVPSTAPSVPPPPPLVPPQVPDVSISKKLKEARQLGCISFTGDLDATAAKDWIIQVSETLNDMRLEDDMKLMVVTRLLEKRARTWWNSVKSRFTTPPTWSDFLRELDGQYYTHFHQKEKKREFLSLKQGSSTIEEYEARFNELMSYVPDLVKTEQDQVTYFEEGLRNEIRDRMTVTGKEPYKEVVQMAMRVEKLAIENKQIRAEFAKMRNLSISFYQPSKKGKDLSTSGSTTAILVASTRPPSQQSQQRPSRFSRSATSAPGKSFKSFDRCRNCKKVHPGPCREPVRCFQCEQQGHIRSACPQLVRATTTVSSPPVGTDTQRRDFSRSQPRQGAVIRSDVGNVFGA